MSVPQPPNQWGAQPPAGGPQWGPPPSGTPQWVPQGPPPSGGGKGKWIFGGIALIAVIAVTVVITVLVVGKNSGGSQSPTPTNGNGSDFASANDKGPVGIITDDPTCAAWQRVSHEYAAKGDSVKWGDRDQTIPASAWTSQQRNMYDTVGQAMKDAADQVVNLVKVTPHRVMREMYGQFIAYADAHIERIPTYVADDRYLAGTADGIASTLSMVCSAIDNRAAQPLAPLIPEAAAPTSISQLAEPVEPQRFLKSANPVCSEWISTVDKFSVDTAAWRATDPNIPATQWTPELKALNDAVAPTMTAEADDLENLGRRSDNLTLEDMAVLAAQYQRAFVKALPTYTTADSYLSEAASYAVSSVNAACKAAGAR
ncbi:hypothetical protein GGC64_002706 [Mycobacterium sp. OAS707]|uniref:hypothetical protein n=1 Tax=Mycobacterium sp. OAS707 TaxID=2663822 RepID=UPI00178B9A1E|nr:hypothetical protein [Mycobacterium sp. OAS707]MBE1548682.1 hypothetical protein [Mycobacterium sp. OAS707]